MTTISRLRKTFAGGSANTDQQAAQRQAVELAAIHDVPLDPIDSGVNVWPPKYLLDSTDPYDGDHYAQDWAEALERVRVYANMQTKEREGHGDE